MIALHLLAGVLALAFPAWDYYDTRGLRTASDPMARTYCYLRTMAVLWLATFAAMAAMPLSRLWYAPPSVAAELSATWLAVAVVLAGVLMVVLLMPLVLAWSNADMREKIFDQMKEVDYLLPQSRAEIALFAGVSVTAGICEEVLFRGFLFAYLHASPWNLEPYTIILVSSAMFGVAHLGQGSKGIVVTGMTGAALGGLYLITGSLLAPIILHILIDLRATALCHLRATTARQDRLEN